MKIRPYFMYLVGEIGGKSLKPILLSHGWVYLEPAEKDENTTRLRYSFLIRRSQPVTIEIRQAKGKVSIQTDFSLTEGVSKEFNTVIRRILSLDFKQDEFLKLCRANKASIILSLAKKGWGRLFRALLGLWGDFSLRGHRVHV